MALSLLQFLKHCGNYRGPHVIIVPKSTLHNWSREVERWTHLSVMKFHGNQEERALLYSKLGTTTDIVVTTYEMIIREKSHFKKVCTSSNRAFTADLCLLDASFCTKID